MKESRYKLIISSPSEGVKISVFHQISHDMEGEKKVCLRTEIKGEEIVIEDSETEEALYQLARNLPEGCEIKSCLSCRHGNFCPVGNYDNEVFCVTEFEPKEKRDLWHVTEDDEERRKRSRTLFHVCDKYVPQSEDYYTYSDYIYKVQRREK